jgi:hypothetical protein
LDDESHEAPPARINKNENVLDEAPWFIPNRNEKKKKKQTLPTKKYKENAIAKNLSHCSVEHTPKRKRNKCRYHFSRFSHTTSPSQWNMTIRLGHRRERALIL